MKKFVLGILLFAFASLGFSQTGGSGGNGCSGTTCSGSTATNNTVVYTGGSGNVAQAIPGVSGTLFPGYAPENTVRTLGTNLLYRITDVKIMKSERSKHDKIHSTFEKNAVPDNDRPITLIMWDPTKLFNGLYYINDRLVYTGIAEGNYHEPERATLLALEYDAKKKTHTDRCAYFEWIEKDAHTSGLAIGPGVSGGGIVGPGTNNTSVTGAAGGMIGEITAKVRDHYTIELDCMNVGQFTPPQLEKKVDEKSTPPSPQPPPAPKASEATPPAPPMPVAPLTTSFSKEADDCLNDKLPQENVYFAFDHPKPWEGDVFSPTVMTPAGLQDNTAAIHVIEQWLENHPHCNIDVVGYASHEGSNAYNNDLGERRPKSVLKVLKEDKKIRGQVFEADSNGKESAAPTGNKEYDWRDRRVSFRIRGSDSSGR